MANYCLPKELTTKFLRALKDGTLNVDELSQMSSADRRAKFAEVVGEGDAKNVNAEFESKLLLKDQKRGLVTWAKNVAGLKEPVRRDIIATIERMDTVLDPKSQQAFLEDYAAKKLGVDVTFEEAKKITDLSHAISKLAEGRSDPLVNIEWGRAMIELNDYVESLLPKGHLLTDAANIPKAVMSTMDFSAAFRQGWGMVSRADFWRAFPAMFKYAFSEKQFQELRAQIVSDPNYHIIKSSGLRVSAIADKLSQREEQYISTLLDKVPLYRGAERAYVGFLNKLRVDSFNRMLKRAELAGEHIGVGSKATKELANVVNDFTGSGNLGAEDRYAAAVPVLNATLFSPRKISATINMLNPRRYLSPESGVGKLGVGKFKLGSVESATARHEAIRNLVGSLALSASVLTLAAMAGFAVETDITSADFGKFKIGKTRYDVTGGNGTYAVLLGRLMLNRTKSTTTGRTTILGKGYKPTTRADLILKFGRNKLSPTASLIADWLYGQDAVGNPFNLKTELLNRAYPLVLQDIVTTAQNDPQNLLGSVIADEFGIGVQTY